MPRTAKKPAHLRFASLVFALSISAAVLSAVAVAAPAPNDDFANARVLSGKLPIIDKGTSTGATEEKGEPGYGSTVWYAWTAPKTGDISLDTCGGDPYAPYLRVYTGSSLSSLTRVPTRFDNNQSTICPLRDPDHDSAEEAYEVDTFRAVKGKTYRIQLYDSTVGGSQVGLVVSEPEVYDVATSISVSRRRVPMGGTVIERLKVTNRGSIPVPPAQFPRLGFGQQINVPGQPHYPGKAVYASVSSPGAHCSHGLYGGGSKVQVAGCDMNKLKPGQSQVARIKIKNIRGAILLDANNDFADDRKGNDASDAVIRLK